MAERAEFTILFLYPMVAYNASLRWIVSSPAGSYSFAVFAAGPLFFRRLSVRETLDISGPG